MEYKTDIENIDSLHLEGFFEGWSTHPDKEGLLDILKNSSRRIIAIEDSRVVGFITAVTDGSFSAYIPLLEVLPEYRERGIGSDLVKKMLETLADFYMVDVVCDEALNGFYEKFGMKKANAMSIRNYQNRSGKNIV